MTTCYSYIDCPLGRMFVQGDGQFVTGLFMPRHKGWRGPDASWQQSDASFTVVREQLAAHPVYKDLRLVIIGDTISQYPAVRQAVMKSRVESVVRFLGFVPFETLRCCS